MREIHSTYSTYEGSSYHPAALAPQLWGLYIGIQAGEHRDIFQAFQENEYEISNCLILALMVLFQITATELSCL